MYQMVWGKWHNTPWQHTGTWDQSLTMNVIVVGCKQDTISSVHHQYDVLGEMTQKWTVDRTRSLTIWWCKMRVSDHLWSSSSVWFIGGNDTTLAIRQPTGTILVSQLMLPTQWRRLYLPQKERSRKFFRWDLATYLQDWYWLANLSTNRRGYSLTWVKLFWQHQQHMG